jgi:diadenosine tetraphosphate (Ap4A) HIT family hydrolase
MNETIEKFGYPGTLIKEYSHWVVLLRPDQATLGSMVLANKSNATALSQVDPAAFAELSDAIRDLEKALDTVFHNDKINYLLLMMVDKYVHFHVLPRYAQNRIIFGGDFQDPGWPGPPNLSYSSDLTSEQRTSVLELLRKSWPSAH